MAREKNLPDALLASPFSGVPAASPKQNEVALKGNTTSRYSGAIKPKEEPQGPTASADDPSMEDIAFKRFLQIALMENGQDLTHSGVRFDDPFKTPVTIGEQSFKNRQEVSQAVDRFSHISDVARGKSRVSQSYNLDFSNFSIRDFANGSGSNNWFKISSKPAKVDSHFALDGSFQQAFQIVLASEGGFSNHKSDKGGATIYGIASRSNPKEYQMIMDQLRRGDKEGAMQTTMQTYKSKYWDTVSGIENMSPSAKLVAFDAAVNHGVGFTNKMVKTTSADADAMISYRSQKYAAIIQNDPSQAVFEKGWGNRLAKLDTLTDTSERNTMVLASTTVPSTKINLRTPAPQPG